MASNSSSILPANEEPFDGINPSDVIPLLLALPVTECKDGRSFWKSYKKWESLTPEQKNKSVQFWKHSISQEVRNRLSVAAREINVVETAEDNARQAITSKYRWEHNIAHY